MASASKPAVRGRGAAADGAAVPVGAEGAGRRGRPGGRARAEAGRGPEGSRPDAILDFIPGSLTCQVRFSQGAPVPVRPECG